MLKIMQERGDFIVKKKSKTAALILASGLGGILGVSLTLISDFILIGRPESSFSFFKLGTESMAGFPQWRITIGTFLGIIVIPMQLSGLVTMYYGLKSAGKIKALAVVLVTAHSLILAVAFHMSYAFIASGWKLYYELGFGDVIALKMLKRFDYYWRIIIVIMAVEIIFTSIVYSVIILRGNTLYPKWMALFNPMFVLVYTYLIILFIPHPVGGFVAPAFLNLATLMFFIFSTVTVYRRLT
jgi:hypothetical protein